MKLNLRTLMPCLTAALFSVTGAIQAQTVISGPNIMTSTWSPAGNPYIVTADCTVPAGQTLTIQPGTTVWMGSGTSLTGNGIISAIGTAVQPIRFEPPVLSQMWNTIIINNTIGTNQFKYCEFMNATNALDFRGASQNVVQSCQFTNSATGVVVRDNSTNEIAFCSFGQMTNGIWMAVAGNYVAGIGRTQTTRILNCWFVNCAGQAVHGESLGRAGGSWQSYGAASASLNSAIKNCFFVNSGSGCVIYLAGQAYIGGCCGTATGYGYGNLEVGNNVFHNTTNTAISLSVGSYAGGGPAILVNNSIVSAGSGVVVQDTWNSTIQNNVFKNCTIAAARSGSLSTVVSFNDFFGNTTNFIGYPVTYGQAILANRNGTACDVLFNIFSDPMFASSSDFHLQTGSPCIDAGEGSGANFDSYFPPSMGSVTNDIGAYGGPGAGQWIVPPPTNAFTLGISKFTMASVTINPPEPGNYRLEYSSALLGTNTWIQITNLQLTTLPFTYTEPATTPARYYRAVKQ